MVTVVRRLCEHPCGRVMAGWEGQGDRKRMCVWGRACWVRGARHGCGAVVGTCGQDQICGA